MKKIRLIIGYPIWELNRFIMKNIIFFLPIAIALIVLLTLEEGVRMVSVGFFYLFLILLIFGLVLIILVNRWQAVRKRFNTYLKESKNRR